MSFTLIIIVITAIISFAAFNNELLMNRLILWPRRMDSINEYYRLLTSGFIHGDIGHLAFNMLTLYFFGDVVEKIYGMMGKAPMFIVLYITGIIVSSIPTYIKHRNNGYYRSLGASGGVNAIMFAFVYFAPWEKIYLWFLPVPGILAAIGILIFSKYMSRRGGDNVNHDAHFWGALYGFLFTLLISPDHGINFLNQLMHPYF